MHCGYFIVDHIVNEVSRGEVEHDHKMENYTGNYSCDRERFPTHHQSTEGTLPTVWRLSDFKQIQNSGWRYDQRMQDAFELYIWTFNAKHRDQSLDKLGQSIPHQIQSLKQWFSTFFVPEPPYPLSRSLMPPIKYYVG